MAIAKKKKRFFEVEIPILSKTTHLIALDIKELEGKYLEYDLTRILRGKNALLQAKVKLEGEAFVAHPTRLKLLPSHLKKIVRKGSDYVEDSFSTDCKNAQLKIKPLLVTRRRVSRAVLNALRKKLKEELTNYVKSRDSTTIFDDILKNKLQKELSLKLKKIYPLSVCEIRVIKVEKELEIPKEEEPKKETKKEKSEEKEIEKKVEETQKE